MAITNKSQPSLFSVPSLQELALDALPIEDVVSSITDPQTTADDVVYDAYMGRLDSAATKILPVAPEYLDRVAQALQATLAAGVAAGPSKFSARHVHATRFDAIYIGLGESLRRHDEAVLQRDKPFHNANGERVSFGRTVWNKIVAFCRWLVGITPSKPDIKPEQSRIYMPNLPMGDVEKIRFVFRYGHNRYATQLESCFKIESDIRHLTPKPSKSIPAMNVYEDVRKLERALQQAVCALLSRIGEPYMSTLRHNQRAAPLLKRIRDEKAPVCVELGRRPSDGVPYIQLVCEKNRNQMFLFSGPDMHPSRTGNLADAEMLESLRKPQSAPRA